MPVLSVDLAARRYADNGIAILTPRVDRIQATLVTCAELGLAGTPDADIFASALDNHARNAGAQLILLDGPQAWRAERSDCVHQRLCERATRTPGKTGLPGVVKPATWTRMALFSIEMFDALDAKGWPRITRAWCGERACIEAFPTHAWRSLGFACLPGKRKALSLAPWIDFLEARQRVRFSRPPSHDELQATVAGLAGVQMIRTGLASCDVHGEDPRLEGGHRREGLIVCPA